MWSELLLPPSRLVRRHHCWGSSPVYAPPLCSLLQYRRCVLARGKPPGHTEERRHNRAQPPPFLPPRNPVVPLVAGKRCGYCRRSPPELLLHSSVDPSELLAAAGAVAGLVRYRSCFVSLVQ
ncbi:uncharacterized protein LOC110265422 [Arachis ipaensis]|uniref:uncharacterized protein LOC110265422 n=1 Tax=Arachis ipaensis TaxID=130454 RepID=UPI000A2AEFC9|nr:uncharacterized protein LOC110265422 [Arachis ipaensis]